MNSDGELRLRVIPGAKVEKLGIENETLKIWIPAAPEDGKANKAVIALLTQRLKLPNNAATIISGQTSRDKRIKITLSE
ncbi:DUF167 domain-containing protein [Sphingorhabdus contaminans]|uniref:UPF0235 protein FOM92_05670 n=1 Tax=Sphingorhabdus contaminans TaxID=1343899 RepID=A0A553WJH6_9SPHN|nr:DUF167 domain-containing protein [Sphingorhabdus contaminans]TSB04885.1 DUF167 domain-containing protein [Sphingorhabdus contaminans]